MLREEWELSNRRRHHRFRYPVLRAEVGEMSGATRDWSFGGARLRLSDEPDTGPDDVVDIALIGMDGQRGHFRGRLVRVEPDRGEAVYAFTELAEDGVDVLAAALRKLSRDSSVPYIRPRF